MNDQDELLKFAVENGIINMNLLKEQIEQIEMKNKEKLLSQHQFKIWQGSDGYWYTYIRDDEKGRVLKKKRNKKELENLICDYCKKLYYTNFSALFDQWINQKLEFGEIQKQTYDRYYTDFERFFVNTGFANKDVSTITELELEEFIKKTIHDDELSRKAYSGLRTILIGVLKYAKKKGFTDISPKIFFGDLELSRKSFKKKIITDEDSVFTKAETKRIEEFLLDDPSLIDLGILLVFQTGLRVGELAALQFSDVDGNKLKIWKTEERFKDEDGGYVFQVRESPKTDAGNRTVILDEKAIKIISMIRKRNPFGEYMFMKNGERVKSRVFTLRLLRVCKKLEIHARSMHKIRKTYATKLINGNVDEKIIMQQMGHTDINCTRNYYYFNDKGIDEATEQIEKALLG